MNAIIFDFDGVIHDTLDLGHRLIAEVYGDLTKDDFKDFFNGNIFEIDQFSEKEPNEKDDRFYKLQHKAFDALKIDENIKANLAELAEDYALFIVTSNQEPTVNLYFNNNNFTNIFREILGAETHHSKVWKFNHIFEKYNLKADECIFVTDTLGDILEANKVGLKSIAVDFGFHERERLEKGNPYKIVSKFDEILEVIKEL